MQYVCTYGQLEQTMTACGVPHALDILPQLEVQVLVVFEHKHEIPLCVLDLHLGRTFCQRVELIGARNATRWGHGGRGKTGLRVEVQRELNRQTSLSRIPRNM